MQGADCIQTLAADTDQQNQLSEKQPSASLFPLSLSLSQSLSPTRTQFISLSKSPTTPPLLPPS